MVYFLCGNVRAWFFKLLFLLRSKMCINKKSRLKLNGSTRKHLAKGPHTAKTEPAQQRRYKQQKEEASTYNAINMDSHFGIHTIFWDTVMKMGEIARTFFSRRKLQSNPSPNFKILINMDFYLKPFRKKIQTKLQN